MFLALKKCCGLNVFSVIQSPLDGNVLARALSNLASIAVPWLIPGEVGLVSLEVEPEAGGRVLLA